MFHDCCKAAVYNQNSKQWMQAFYICVEIYTEKQPQDAPQLMKYADIMQRLEGQAGQESGMKQALLTTNGTN